MITVAVLEDRKKTAEIFNENGLSFNESSGCMQAVCGSDCLGCSLYSLDGDKIIIYKIYPLNDIMLADGILRSTLHLAARRGITNAYYTQDEELFERLGFIKDKSLKILDITMLTKECCGGCK